MLIMGPARCFATRGLDRRFGAKPVGSRANCSGTGGGRDPQPRGAITSFGIFSKHHRATIATNSEDAMTKRHEAKYKIDRRMGQNIWGRPKSPINKREYGPGQHGQRRKGKLSDYGVQL